MKTLKGKWNNGIEWELSLSDNLPPKELITAVFCVPITKNNEIILARSRRGWGLVGGHVEKGETITEALKRETLEEGGFKPKDPQLFAVMKISPSKPVLRPNSKVDYYPFPVGYQVYYWATSDLPIAQPSGKEIIEARSFALYDIEQLAIADYQVIALGYKAYQSLI